MAAAPPDPDGLMSVGYWLTERTEAGEVISLRKLDPVKITLVRSDAGTWTYVTVAGDSVTPDRAYPLE